ncbi:MAG: 2Fe-2S iron-sulfur cluster-binding protein [Deferribacterota bacterium]|nr:2Fe-2S iron-sulfur cluster-binding protein [Deferribacterota bacterium]
MIKEYKFTINKKNISVKCNIGSNLLNILKNELKINSIRYGCGKGLCGACSILVGGKVFRSCQLTVDDVINKDITTLEGLTYKGKKHPLITFFEKEQAFQCGYCTNGMIITAASLLNENINPTRKDIINHMNNNICRCGTHGRIIDAIIKASNYMRKKNDK